MQVRIELARCLSILPLFLFDSDFFKRILMNSAHDSVNLNREGWYHSSVRVFWKSILEWKLWRLLVWCTLDWIPARQVVKRSTVLLDLVVVCELLVIRTISWDQTQGHSGGNLVVQTWSTWLLFRAHFLPGVTMIFSSSTVWWIGCPTYCTGQTVGGWWFFPKLVLIWSGNGISSRDVVLAQQTVVGLRKRPF